MSVFEEIKDALDEYQTVTITGVGKGGAVRLAVELAKSTGKKIVFVVPDTREINRIWMNLYHLNSIYWDGMIKEEEIERPEICSTTLLLPQSLYTPYQDVIEDSRTTFAILSCIWKILYVNNWRYLVTCAPNLVLKFPPGEFFRSKTIFLKLDEEIEPAEVAKLLSSAGYHRTEVVDSPGAFSLRGGIMDVFSPLFYFPVRIQWYGSAIEKMRFFDPLTQRSEDEVDFIALPPLSYVPFDENTILYAARNLEKLCQLQDVPAQVFLDLTENLKLNIFRSGHMIRRFLPAFYNNPASLLDLIEGNGDGKRNNPIFILVEPDDIYDELERFKNSLIRDFHALREKELAAYEPQMVSLLPEKINEELHSEKRKLINITSSHSTFMSGLRDVYWKVSSENSQKVIQLEAPDLKQMMHQSDDSGLITVKSGLRPVAKMVKGWLDGGMRVTMTALSQTGAKRIEELFKSYGIQFGQGKGVRCSISVGPVSAGFVLPGEKEALITEEEIFGKKVRGRKIRSAQSLRIDDLQLLKQGDYVVHEVHGIGVYDGQVFMKVDDVDIELIKIIYKGGDILYVPVYHLNQVQKYIGGKNPALDRLGGETFLKTKLKTKKNAYELAEKLLNLYASRKAAVRESYPIDRDACFEFESLFPYEETADQIKAVDDIMNDLDKFEPMDRLLCGDVGFGKTEVAIRAAWRVAMAGKQVAVLVPTTVLAHQHYRTFQERFAETPLKVEMLSRFQNLQKRREIVRKLKEGTIDIIIGTHRLLSADVHFKNLGLLIIDEEHRFGVTQKERIKFLRPSVDVLTMTATPIPRTLQMGLGKILSLSIIATPPAHRLPIKTVVAKWDDSLISDAIKMEIGRGGQVYFLHNRIESLDIILGKLRKLLPDVKFESAHGRMNPLALEKVMLDFISGKIDVLVCTSIIESGLDIPNVNTLFVNDAHRFGLAQLYQIRGRIGRASEQAYAYFLLPERIKLTPGARDRIDALIRLSSLGCGFNLAVMDLELRGAGELFGEKQSGSIRKVGFEMYLKMLEEAASVLKGEEYKPDIEPEIKISIPAFIPEEYISEPWLRLSFYKRLASADDENQVWEIIEEMEDRFGSPPLQVENLRDLMIIKTMLKRLKLFGIEIGKNKVQIHLSPQSPISASDLVRFVQSGSEEEEISLTPDMKLIFSSVNAMKPLELARCLLERLMNIAS